MLTKIKETMSHTTTINTSEGVVNINSDLFKGYNKEAHEILEKISELQKDLKEIVETASETTGLKKPKVAKYFKERYNEATKVTKETGELFAQLDSIIE
jgi:ABC-type Zn uptake system ZnuABC Zn-binding protein ZnuA